MLFRDAAARWLREKRHKTTLHEDAAKLAVLGAVFGAVPVASIDTAAIAAFAASLTGRRPGTVNRYLALLRSILRRACIVWGVLERVPYVDMAREPVRRVRWLAPRQVKTLLNALPEHHRCVVVFALATGLRQANVMRLRWAHVDLRRRHAWIDAQEVKNRVALGVPLNETAMAILKAQRGKHPDRVWTYRGRPWVTANTRVWRRALGVAGISDFRWHDLRHTWASWHAQHGTPLYVLQELGGWATEAMVKRYAHLAPSQHAAHAKTIDGLL